MWRLNIYDQIWEQEFWNRMSEPMYQPSKQAIDYGKADAARAAQQKLRTAQKNMVNNEAGKGAQRGVVKNSDAYFTQLQDQATTEALVLLGFDRASVMRDVVPNNRYGAILKNPNPYLKAFNSGIFDSKNGFTAYQSNQLGKSLYALKFYPDRGNTLGIIYSNPTDHFFETMAEVLELIYGKTGANHYMHEWNATGFLKYKGK